MTDAPLSAPGDIATLPDGSVRLALGLGIWLCAGPNPEGCSLRIEDDAGDVVCSVGQVDPVGVNDMLDAIAFALRAKQLVARVERAQPVVPGDIIEPLLTAIHGTEEWDEGLHRPILNRWRAARPNGGRSDWLWWVRPIGAEHFVHCFANREALFSAVGELSRTREWADGFEIVQAWHWDDEIEGAETRFVEARGHEIFPKIEPKGEDQ